MSASSSHQAPIVQYGVENKRIPGDPTGWWTKDCGNLFHWGDVRRYRFPEFDDSDLDPLDDSQIHNIARNGITSIQERGRIIRDTLQGIIIDDDIHSFDVRIFHLKDVVYDEEDSYSKADRAKVVERASSDRMRMIEPPMGRDTENLSMAQRMGRGSAPMIPQHKDGSENRIKWYKEMRLDSCYTFWVKADRAQRDGIRAVARTPPGDLAHLIQQIKDEDRCHTKDAFWEYQQDEAAAADPNIYQ